MQLEGTHTNFTINSFKNQSNSKLSRRLSTNFLPAKDGASLHYTCRMQGKWSPRPQTTRADGPGMGLTMLSWPRRLVIRANQNLKVPPSFFTGKKTCQTGPVLDPSDRLFWDRSLCCLNMVYHRYPNFEPQQLGLHQQP